MKKLICLLLATMMLATIFVGCSNDENVENESPSQDVMETTAEPTEEPTEEPEEFGEDPEEDFTEGPEEDPTEKPNETLSPIDAPIWLDSTDELGEFTEQFHINDGIHDEELDCHFSMTLLLPKGVTTKTEYDDSQFPYLVGWNHE